MQRNHDPEFNLTLGRIMERRRLAEVLADRSRELADKVKRDLHNRVKDLERRAKAISVEERIRQLYENGKVEEAMRMAQELRQHLQREHGEDRHYESLEREGLIVSRRGKGFFAEQLTEQTRAKLARQRLAEQIGPVIRAAKAEGMAPDEIRDTVLEMMERLTVESPRRRHDG